MSTQTTRTSAQSAGNSSGLAAGLAGLRASLTRSKITWQDTEAEPLMQIVSAVVDEGSLISFSRTSDGGALVLTILTDKLPERFYAANEDELAELVAQLQQVVKYTT